MTEMIDIYDKNRNKTDLQLPRKRGLAKNQFMLYALVLIQNQEGKILITRRALGKKWAAGAWEIPGGGVLSGETTREAVVREAKEETALDISKGKLELLYTYRNEDAESGDNYFCDIYRCQLRFDMSQVVVQEEEVIGVKLVSLSEMKTLSAEEFLHRDRICKALGIED